MTERIALYPGTFDPPTFGHLDLIERATKLFDRLLVAVAENDAKQCLFTPEERLEILEGTIGDVPNVSITSFQGLTAEFARQQKAVVLVRGLRAISDYEFELSMAIMNQKLNAEVDTVLLMPSEPYLFLSSRMVREIAQLGGDIGHFVPPEIAARLRKKLGQH